ncbi:MAG: hypothetical protein CMQ61_06550 [Gammaproteobacteria bacterium]|nr:hypothetical protein [Gammaproteobacteria bacterium]
MKLSSFGFVADDDGDASVEAQVQQFNQTARDYPATISVANQFARMAAQTPHAVAVSATDVSLTYEQLERRANQVAHALRDAHGVEDGDLVGVALPRSGELIVVLLGILKAGGAYLPLDLEYPASRLTYMVEHAAAKLVITDDAGEQRFPTGVAAIASVGTLTTEDAASEPGDVSPATQVDGGSLAYVIYTSGSTGQPKAVAISHRAILRLVCNTTYADFSKEQVFLQYAPVSFDAATFEIWGPLLNGARLAVAPAGQQSLHELATTIAREQVSTLWLTAGLFNLMIDENPQGLRPVRQLLVGGEALSVAHIRKARDALPDCQLINGYGPTENTTFSCCYAIAAGDYRTSIPIGGPIANSTAYVLDEERRLLPPGATGELYLGGDGLALGYWNDPQLTAERFVAHPFMSGQKLYRTGDLACWRSDGTLEYLGRIDNQIKIRGFRIEPGEIEVAIQSFPGIKAAVVGTHAGDNDAVSLVAHFTVSDVVQTEALKDHLGAQLPDFMMPQHLLQVDNIPLNPNGKVDRSALPAPAVESATVEYTAPGSETERELALIWEQVLGTSPVGVTQDFFSLGGHSLLAAKLVSLIEQRFGAVLALTTVFTQPTIRALAQTVLDTVQFGNEAVDHALVPLSAEHSGPKVFAFPPGTTDALSYSRLARMLPAFDFYAFNFIEADTRIADYADLVVATDPTGPYLLFGYSGGGNIAFAVATELERRGLTVAGVVMLDSSRFMQTFAFPESEAQDLANAFLESDGVNRVVNAEVLRDKVVRRIKRYYAYLSSVTETQPIAANIHLIKSPHSDAQYIDEGGTVITSQPAWREVTTGRFECLDGAGGHGDMLLEPHVEANCKALLDVFRAVATSAN